MRKIFFIGIMVVLVSACGTKKRTTYSKKNSGTTTVEKNRTDDTGLYPMPEDNGRFMEFPIASIEDYIDTFSEIAQFEMKAYGIPASITLAQGILESGFGRGELTLKTNNHFGIKCHTGWDGPYALHDDDERGECFRKYNHPMYSFRDHSLFLTTRSRYAFLFDLSKDDYKGWAYGLKKAGYATDRKYPHKLISFIERYKLYEYDTAVLQQGYVVEKKSSSGRFKVHVVKEGDTLYSISRRYFVSVEELKELNALNDNIISVGQELRIQSNKIR
ncbi:glucosaminidase domain-containing protein [Muriicola sp. E247]|uniref:glucosaminidase domain-containing protein n=1 Tax=Muriicola sp. E247 TaxID=3242730 RepID=UPI0035245A8E